MLSEVLKPSNTQIGARMRNDGREVASIVFRYMSLLRQIYKYKNIPVRAFNKAGLRKNFARGA